MKNFLNKFLFQKVSIFITVVSFTYNVVLDRDLDCTCNEHSNECLIYMTLPTFIFFVLILWTNKVFPSSCRYVCTCENKRTWAVCGVLVLHIIKAAIIACLWSLSVLMDGHWYACCRNYLPKNQTQLPCKDKTTLTTEEHVIIAELKNESKLYGSIVLVIVCFLFLMSLCDWRCCKSGCCKNIRDCCKTTDDCCKTRDDCCKMICDCCDRRVYDELILKESEDVLMEVLRESAKTKLKTNFEKKINGTQWTDCFDVVQEIIENSAVPEPPENEGNRSRGEEQQEEETENENSRETNDAEREEEENRSGEKSSLLGQHSGPMYMNRAGVGGGGENLLKKTKKKKQHEDETESRL